MDNSKRVIQEKSFQSKMPNRYPASEEKTTLTDKRCLVISLKSAQIEEVDKITVLNQIKFPAKIQSTTGDKIITF